MNGKNTTFLLVILLVMLSSSAKAQFYTLGDDPMKARWMQIKSEHYNIIYPREIDSLARLYLFAMENKRASVMEPLGISPKRIPVVLHPYTTVSNGSVSWAPKRVDLFTSPDPYGGTPEPWIDQLTVHESRHIGQTEHFTKGIYKPFYYLLGDQPTGLGVGLYPSKAFLEGDAVVAETELSNAGRGRQAEFLMYTRAAYLNGDYRNWDRYRLGSYKYFTPDHYVFGYLYNATVRYETGNYHFPEFYLSSLVKHWYNPNVINKTYKDLSGNNKKHFFKASQELLTDIWKKDLESRGKLSPTEPILKKEPRLYCDYQSAVYLYDQESPYHKSVFSIKDGFEYAPQLIRIDSTGKEHLLRPFNNIASALKLSQDRIYWSETTSQESSDLEDFSVIRYYDLKKGKTYNLSDADKKYFNPYPSDSGDTIAVTEYPVTGSSYMVLLSAKDGSEIMRAEAPGKGQLRDVSFIGDDIYCTAILDRGLGIYKYEEGGWIEIVPQQNQSIDDLSSYEDGLLFSSDMDGVLNIYTYNIETKQLDKITNSKYGVANAYLAYDTRTLYFSEFTPKGYRPAKLSLDSLTRIPSSFSEPYRYPLAEILSSQASQGTAITVKDSIDAFDTAKYPARKYSKLTHLFRFHSWAPVYYNIDNILNTSYDQYYDVASLGVTLYSQNTLGSAVTMVGYSYHEGFHAGHIKFTYEGLNPYLEASFDINDRYSEIYEVVDVALEGNKRLSVYPDTWNPYIKTNFLIYYPFSFYRGGWNKQLIPQFNWNWSNDSYYSYEKSKYITKHQLSYGLTYFQVRPIAHSQIYPRLGFSITAQGASAPGTGENFGNLLYLYGYLYLPGITKQQGLKLTGTWQRQFADNKNYYLGSFASLPTGYNDYYSPTKDLLMGTARYAIPVYLGDFSIWRLLYFKRMQLIPFGEFARDLNRGNVQRDFYSYGADILFDFNIFATDIVSLSAGLRYARTGPQEGNQNYFNFLFSFSIN